MYRPKTGLGELWVQAKNRTWGAVGAGQKQDLGSCGYRPKTGLGELWVQAKNRTWGAVGTGQKQDLGSCGILDPKMQPIVSRNSNP